MNFNLKMDNVPSNLEYMVKIHERLNSTYTDLIPIGGMIILDGKTQATTKRIQRPYFKLEEISEKEAEKIIIDIIARDLITYPIEQNQELNQAKEGMLTFQQFARQPGYSVVMAKEHYPSIPIEKTTLLNIGISQIPLGYRNKFAGMVTVDKNKKLMRFFLPEIADVIESKKSVYLDSV